MRFISLALLPLLIVLCPSESFAQTATQDVQISATVAATCTINNVATGGVSTVTIPVSASGAVDTTPLTPSGSPFASVACNAPSNLQLTSQSGGVKTATTAVTGFAAKIDYTASATWHSVTATINTASAGPTGPYSGTAAPVATAFSGSLSVSITPTANALPLLAGSYSDTLRVTLVPQ